MKDWPDIFRHLTMLSQIGLSLAAPLLICILLCNWLCNRFSMAGWIYLPGFFFGSCPYAFRPEGVLRLLQARSTD